MSLILKHQTLDQFESYVRERFRSAQGEEAINVAAYVIAAVQRGDLTDAGLRGKFGLNAIKWAALKAKMQTFVTARNTIRSALGE
jgi:hypothetical protein